MSKMKETKDYLKTHPIHTVNKDNVCCRCGKYATAIVGSLYYCDECRGLCKELSDYKSRENDEEFTELLDEFDANYDEYLKILTDLDIFLKSDLFKNLLVLDYNYFEKMKKEVDIISTEAKQESDKRNKYENECVKKCSDKGHIQFKIFLQKIAEGAEKLKKILDDSDVLQNLYRLKNMKKVIGYDKLEKEKNKISYELELTKNQLSAAYQKQHDEYQKIADQVKKKEEEIKKLKSSLNPEQIRKVFSEYSRELLSYFPHGDYENIIDDMVRGKHPEARRGLRSLLSEILPSPASSPTKLSPSVSSVDPTIPIIDVKKKLDYDDEQKEKNLQPVDFSQVKGMTLKSRSSTPSSSSSSVPKSRSSTPSTSSISKSRTSTPSSLPKKKFRPKKSARKTKKSTRKTQKSARKSKKSARNMRKTKKSVRKVRKTK